MQLPELVMWIVLAMLALIVIAELAIAFFLHWYYSPLPKDTENYRLLSLDVSRPECEIPHPNTGAYQAFWKRGKK